MHENGARTVTVFHFIALWQQCAWRWMVLLSQCTWGCISLNNIHITGVVSFTWASTLSTARGGKFQHNNKTDELDKSIWQRRTAHWIFLWGDFHRSLAYRETVPDLLRRKSPDVTCHVVNNYPSSSLEFAFILKCQDKSEMTAPILLKIERQRWIVWIFTQNKEKMTELSKFWASEKKKVISQNFIWSINHLMLDCAFSKRGVLFHINSACS